MRRAPDPPPEYGQWLRFYREEAGLTQRELANKARVGYVSINHLENDRRWATDETAAKIARALGVSVDEVFPQNGMPSPYEIVRAHIARQKAQRRPKRRRRNQTDR